MVHTAGTSPSFHSGVSGRDASHRRITPTITIKFAGVQIHLVGARHWKSKVFYALFFYKNIFYKNIEAEILKRIDIILCVETFVNTIQFYVFNLTV